MVLLEEVEAAPVAEEAAPAEVVEVEVEVKRVGTMNHFSPGTVNRMHLFLYMSYYFFLSLCQSLHDSQFMSKHLIMMPTNVGNV